MITKKELEIKRKRLEVIRLEASIAESEYTIDERLADISRLEEQIAKTRELINNHQKELAEFVGKPAGEQRNG